MLTDYVQGSAVTFSKNDIYWDKEKIAGQSYKLPFVDKIIYRTIKDEAAYLTALRTAKLDVLEGLRWSAVEELKKNAPALKFKRWVDTGGTFIAMRVDTKPFDDIRVRRALNLAFNFEAMNDQIMYAQYTRTQSFFDNSELKSKGLPQGRELEILTEVKDQIPAEVFTTEYKNPVGGTDAQMRPNLAEAAKLFTAAGWTVKGRQLVNAKGEPFRIEILLNSPAFERHAGRYIDDLKKLGIEASIRTVDSAQYQRRIRSFDFDMVVGSFGQSISPGNEQRFFWGSASADQEGSRNLAGIKNPAVDKIIDRVIFAKDRADLVAATHALDRVLLWNAYLVPMWHYPYDRMAWWDRFGRPDKLPSQSVSFQRVWWFDAAKGGKAQ
jgi:microcin C transport system substrate-binding protein